MKCNLCGNDIYEGDRAVEVSYGNVYKITGTISKRLEIVGDRSEYFHTNCFKPTWEKKVLIISEFNIFRADRVNLKVVDSQEKVENWLNEHPNKEYQIDEFEVE